MRKVTKLFIGTLCFISSASMFAANHKGEAMPLTPVTIPNFSGGFEFTAGALYMKPSSENLAYYTHHTAPNIAQNLTVGSYSDYKSDTYLIDPNYQWGLLVGLGYVMPNTANDIRLDWMSFHNHDSDSTHLTENLIYPPILATTLTQNLTINASGKIDYSFDAVDLTVGQYIDIGPRLQTRLFAGLRYARLDSNLQTDMMLEYPYDGVQNHYATQTKGLTTEYSQEQDSHFTGIGPLFGIKANYAIGGGFAITGMMDAALLVGNISLKSDSELDGILYGYHYANSQSNQLNMQGPAFYTHEEFDDLDVISPAFDAKFGLNYLYQCHNGTQMGFELGYQVSKYFDVIRQTTANQQTSMSTSQNTLATQTHNNLKQSINVDSDLTNFGLNGPYLTLNIKM